MTAVRGQSGRFLKQPVDSDFINWKACMPEQPLIVVGEVSKPHGLAGEFSIMSHVDSPDFFGHVPRLYLRVDPRARPRRVRLRSWRLHKTRVLITLDHIEGRDQADRLRGAQLLVHEEDLPPRQEGEIYQRELIDADVLLPSGEILGRIRSVSDAGGQELWTIVTNGGQEVLFPAHEQLIQEVDLERRIIRIDPPPGLLELYLGPRQAQA